MAIDVPRIRTLLGYNRDYIRAIDRHYRFKAGRYWWLLYRELRAERRTRTVAMLELMTPEERLRWLRVNTWRLERLRSRAAPHARALLVEYEARARIAELELYVPRALKAEDLLPHAISLKTEELRFLNELADSLKATAPERPELEAEVRDYASRVERWLAELKAMTGSLEGRVFDAETRKPIEGASVEIAGLHAITNAEGHYRIDGIPSGTHVARCLAPEYEVQEAPVEIRGGAVTTKDWYLKRVVVPPPPVTRVLQSRMFYRSYKAKMTPQPFAFLVVFVKTREPEKYPEEFFKSALDFLTKDPEAFPTLGMAITSVGTLWLKRGKFTTYPAGAYSVDGRSVRAVDWDEVEGEARKFGVSPEELIDQIRYTCVFYRIRMGVARIYREYIGKLEFREGRWVIIPDWGRTRVEPRETLMPEAPSVEELEL